MSKLITYLCRHYSLRRIVYGTQIKEINNLVPKKDRSSKSKKDKLSKNPDKINLQKVNSIMPIDHLEINYCNKIKK